MTDIAKRLWDAEMKGNNSAILAEARREIERLRQGVDANDIPETEQAMDKGADEIERLQKLKMPASRQLLNVTKAALEHAEEECERLRAALRDLIADIEDYERVNNLSPSPGRKDCWQSVTNARRALEGKQ